MNLPSIKHLTFSLFALLLWSCETNCSDTIDTSSINIEVTINRLEQQYQTIKTPKDAAAFLNKNEKFTSFNRDAFTQPGIESSQVNDMLIKQALWLGNAPFDTLLMDVEKQFGDFKTEEEELTTLFKNIKFYYPDFIVPEVNTLISGFGGYVLNDGEDVLLLGLDYFMDSTATYTPPREELPDYLKKHLVKEKIASKAAFAISDRFLAFDDKNSKLINNMILYGKQYYFAHQVLPCREEAHILEYTPKEWAGIKHNEYKIYTYFTKNELFYNTRAENNRLFISDRPKCPEIADDCPGRIARWLGYEIVKAYVEKNDVSLQELMTEKNHVKIFTKSGYKPKKP